MSSGTSDFHSDWESQREMLSELLDGELDPTQRESLESHLGECERCRLELAALRRTRALLRALPQPTLPRSFTLPVEVPANVRSIADAPARSRRGGDRIGALPRLAQRVGSLAAAAGIVLLLGSWIVGLSGGGTRSASTARSVAAGASAQNSKSTAPTTNAQAHTPPAYGDMTQPADASATSTAAQAGATTATSPSHAQSSGDTATSLPVAPLTGAGLTIGGVLLVVVGRTTKSRQERRARAS